MTQLDSFVVVGGAVELRKLVQAVRYYLSLYLEV